MWVGARAERRPCLLLQQLPRGHHGQYLEEREAWECGFLALGLQGDSVSRAQAVSFTSCSNRGAV